MKMKRLLTLAVVLLSGLLVVGSAIVGATSASATGPTHCQPALFTQNSGAGATYHVTVCDALKVPATGKEWQLIVDGSYLQNKAVILGFQVPKTMTIASTSATTLPPPGGPDWNCQEYKSYYSYDCISSFGFLYGGVWGATRDFYQHPNPSSDYVVNEPYFMPNDSSNPAYTHGMTNVPHYMRRVVIVNDGSPGINGLIEPVNWDASQGDLHPAPPTTCMVLTGPNTGHMYPCTALDVKSILDYWYQARVVTNPW
jgi:hypothetical protein